LFDDFQPGTLMGESVQAYDAQQAQRWQSIFGSAVSAGEQAADEGASLAVIGMMRAFLHVVAPQPPGCMHAGQQFSLHRLPQPGEAMRMTVTCVAKEVRLERKYVTLRVQGTGQDERALFDGRLSLIWAA
jgi:acyl dehydratase